ncbi:uncharacterized protein LOC134258565 [Saccostrea cucullata]|uniref:uncharacterized protein LOC134258565 n=1 Tax=Saccostrea cuccullata TaxID=36930 RepID=UPI002ED5309B
MDEKMHLTNGQQRALKIALEGHNLYVGGQAGTGKSVLLSHIFESLHNKKKVALTCTTGIACTNFPSRFDAVTIHSWAGLDDGRHDTSEIKSIVKHHKKDVYNRICATDVLIVDEISMLSQRLLEQLEEVCSLRDEPKYFGGIQVVLCGDFMQLPPVRNAIYNDAGNFCFLSPLFDTAFPHRIILKDVVRQSDIEFVCTINEIARGSLSQKSKNFLQSLDRPLHVPSSVKLYATNELVNRHNRKCLFEMPGIHTEYLAEDSGDISCLSRVAAPQVLWLKKDCPVILLKNLSKKLVNGLQGTIMSCERDGPVVHFASVDETVKMKQERFSVFSPVLRRNLAERKQIPVKLAFALTIHKAQGMTLECVEIDCQQIFSPGQLGVGVSRVKSPTGLRLINFNETACIPMPTIIFKFLDTCTLTMTQDADLGCCKNTRIRCNEKAFEENYHLEPVVQEHDMLENVEDSHGDIDSILDDMKHVQTDDSEGIELPEGLDIHSILTNIYVQDAETKVQKQTNCVIDTLLTGNFDYDVKKFCSHTFSVMTECVESLKIDRENPLAVKPDKLSHFFKQCHQFQTSDEFKACTLLMFFDVHQINPVSPQVMAHIAFNIFVHIRKFILGQLEKVYKIGDKCFKKRSLTEESLGKVRYVGGYCVAKTRHHYNKILRQRSFKIGESNQKKYDEAFTIIQILDNFRENEVILGATSSLPQTLVETAVKQNISRGLTNITDKMFLFFMSVCELCLSVFIEKNLNIHGNNIYEACKEKIHSDGKLYQLFLDAVNFSPPAEFLQSQSIIVLLDEMVDRVNALETLYKVLTEKFMMVMLNQYRKDILSCLSIHKKMAHRKQILVKS